MAEDIGLVRQINDITKREVSTAGCRSKHARRIPSLERKFFPSIVSLSVCVRPPTLTLMVVTDITGNRNGCTQQASERLVAADVHVAYETRQPARRSLAEAAALRNSPARQF